MTEKLRSVDLMVKTALASPEIIDELKADPVATLKRLQAQTLSAMPPRALESDKIIYRIVVGALSLTVLIVVIGVIILKFSTSGTFAVPDILTALGSAAIGALAGLLAPSPVGR